MAVSNLPVSLYVNALDDLANLHEASTSISASRSPNCDTRTLLLFIDPDEHGSRLLMELEMIGMPELQCSRKYIKGKASEKTD